QPGIEGFITPEIASQFSGDITRSYGINRNAGLGQLRRPLPDHAVQGSLGRRISGDLRLAAYGGNGSGKNDAPVALPGHIRSNVSAQSPLRGQIARNNAFELLLWERQQRLAMLYARIGKKDIDLSQTIEHGINSGNGLVGIQNIEGG